MAAIVFAVGVRIGRLSALMAMGNYILGNTLTKPVIKYKVFSGEAAF